MSETVEIKDRNIYLLHRHLNLEGTYIGWTHDRKWAYEWEKKAKKGEERWFIIVSRIKKPKPRKKGGD